MHGKMYNERYKQKVSTQGIFLAKIPSSQSRGPGFNPQAGN